MKCMTCLRVESKAAPGVTYAVGTEYNKIQTKKLLQISIISSYVKKFPHY